MDYAERRREEAKRYLASPFAKSWLKKMRYTVKENKAGKYLFISILPGYKKISDESFQKLVEALYYSNFEGRFAMHMWIGGKVDWTMIYHQPFTRIHGHETFWCGGVGEDNYSPEDWERDMKILGENVTQKEYIEYIL